MFGKPRRAVRTLDSMSAVPADEQRSITAPVQKQHGLFAALEICGKLVNECRRQKRHAPRAFLRVVFFKVKDFNFRQHCLGKALGQFHAVVFAFFNVDDGFQIGSSRGQDNRNFLQMCAQYRHVPPLIGNEAFLLERMVVALINDNNP